MNFRALVIVLCLPCLPAFSAAPINDSCAGALSLSAGVPYSMSTAEATSAGDPVPACSPSAGKGVWFSFTPFTSGAVTISLCGSTFDTVLAAYTGSCGGLTPVGNSCSDDSSQCGAQSMVAFVGTAGATYRILAAGYSSASGTLTIRADVVPVKIIQQPAGGTVQAGETYTLSVQAIGSPAPTYQWQMNGSPISGATRSWHSLPNVAPAAQGGYSVVATSSSMSETSQVAMVNVSPALDLALDAAGLTWTTGGGVDGWFRQTDVMFDFFDSARCGTADGVSTPWMQTIITGAATLKFWWRFPCPLTNTDYVSMTVNGQEQARLASEVDSWYEQTVYLAAGSQTCRWTYVKGLAPSGGPAFVDLVTLALGGTAAQVKTSPQSQVAVAGTNISFFVEPLGTPPFTYQWLYKGGPLPGATEQSITVTNVLPRDAGNYQATVDNSYGGPVASGVASLNVTTIPLAQALDYRALPVTSPASAWFGQVGSTHDAVDAIRSGDITHNQTSTMQFVATGPANVSFWWKVSSETNYDALRFYIDSTLNAQIWGEAGWSYQTFSIPPGTHLVRWAYEKDLSLSRGQDAGWLDQVIYDGAPFLIAEPAGPGKVVVSWPGTLNGFTLQTSSLLQGGVSWSTSPGSSVLVGDEWKHTNQAVGPLQLYRLIK